MRSGWTNRVLGTRSDITAPLAQSYRQVEKDGV